ncbi:Outer membrane protein beta-barrel domain-containing protein [Polaribacter sp. KT25b]|uniref:outer membrane beta-barrel protein n=1 Tax=Polaribacter sp. KT25b TaxID=1855336 RepID=UPI00087DCB30|nr:outer membrane beta-barrel protein [Polaribacter sp. KT25b]SDS03934.1 Outer membrane protein beta-barrel domain-containing protein [Polaribacter sp. KT25b]
MKKIILIMFLTFAISETTNAQIDFGIKGGVNYNNNGDATFSTAGNDIIDGAESKSGYHAGIWFRGKLPIIGLYLRPEIVYTQIKSEYLYKSLSTDYDFKKLDVPVLLGKKVLGFGNIFIGPSFQYILEDEFKFSTLSTDDFDKFSVGLQMGFGVEFGSLGIDVRWERGLSNTEANFVDSNTNVNIDNRTNQIIFGVSIKL